MESWRGKLAHLCESKQFIRLQKRARFVCVCVALHQLHRVYGEDIVNVINLVRFCLRPKDKQD